MLRLVTLLTLALLCATPTAALTVQELPNLTVYCGAGDFASGNSSEMGAVAVNGNIALDNYGAGSALPPAPFGARSTVVAQGNVTLTNVGVFGGNLSVCGTVTQSDVNIDGGVLSYNCSAFDFASTNAYLAAFSRTFSQLAATGAPTRIDNEFTFTATNGTLVNVYNVPARLFADVQDLNIDAPAGVFVVINIDGNNNTFADFQTILNGGIQPPYVLYNFFNTTTLALYGIAVEGSVIAPAAVTTFSNGRVDGSLFVASVTGDAGYNYFPPLTPPCPVTPCQPCPPASPFPSFGGFAFNALKCKSAQNNGTFAAGGFLGLHAFAVLAGNPAAGACPLALLSGGDLVFGSGQVQGDVVAGAAASLSDVSQPAPCNVTQGVGPDSVLNFTSAQENLLAWSSAYGSRAATSPTLRTFNTVTLQTAATASGVSVFSFPSELLLGCTGVDVIAPAGQLVLINVPGANNTIANFDVTLSGGASPSFLLWNFFETLSLDIANCGLSGTVLAPQAAVSFESGSLNGALLATNITGAGTFSAQAPVVPVCPPCPINPCQPTVPHTPVPEPAVVNFE